MDAEYEIESIIQARVARKAKKVLWQYFVKWKGYSSDENTWEPATSFSTDCERIFGSFWERVDTKGRDPQNLTLFEVGETFLPMGPPRRKPVTRKSTLKLETQTPPTAGPSNESIRSSKRRRSSPPHAEIEGKPSKRTRGREPEPLSRSVEKAAPRPTLPRAPTKPTTSTASSTRSNLPRKQRPRKKRSLSPQEVPASEEEEEVAMLVDPQEQLPAEPSQQRIVDPSPQDDAVIVEPTKVPQEQASPATRNKKFSKEGPRVKMVDDSQKSDEVVLAKARNVSRNGPSNANETSIASSSKSPVRNSQSPRKPGPGRSSSGLIANKTTSSLLTFEKGALKSVKGKFVAPVSKEDGAEGRPELFDESAADIPTSEELLQLGGLNSTAAEALDDFEEEIPADVEAPETPSAIQQSVAAAKNSLFPPGAAVTPSFTNSVWRRSTIFGPLGLGSDASPVSPSADDASRKPLFLKLDTTVSLPLTLSEVSQSLDSRVCDMPNGAPGKFFANANARKLLDTVRTGGASARACLGGSASEEQKAHFARFRARLDQGELFTVMVNSTFLGFSSSATPLMQRLNLPSTLTAFADSVFVAELEIENYTAYLDIVEMADTSRW